MKYVEISDLIDKMTDSITKNNKIIEEYTSFDNLIENYAFEIALFERYEDENKLLYFLEALIDNGYDVNRNNDILQNNILHTALFSGYSEQFIRLLTDLLLINNFTGLNKKNTEGNTVYDMAILSTYYEEDYFRLYNFLVSRGFNEQESEIAKTFYNRHKTYFIEYTDNEHDMLEYLDTLSKQLLHDIEFSDYDNIDEINELRNSIKDFSLMVSDMELFINSELLDYEYDDIDNYIAIDNIEFVPFMEDEDNNKEEVKKYNILTNKEFKKEPVMGRDKEITNIFLALASGKMPILVGESGVGKTSLIDEIAYLIQTDSDKVPTFLKGQTIIEVTPSEIVSGAKYVGDFEKRIALLIDEVKKNDAILFIDEIHTIYGTGASEKSDVDLSQILKHYIDRENIRIIGTTTLDEYNKYFAEDALKRRFDKILIDEVDENTLKHILKDYFEYKEKEYNIGLNNIELDFIIYIITILTKKKHRNYQDIVNNPDLALSIINRAFANARINNKTELDMEDIIESIKDSKSRIYGRVISEVLSIIKKHEISSNKIDENVNKIIKFRQ